MVVYADGVFAMAAVIEVKDLTKSFGKLVAVDHISFEVEPGQIVGFLGPNGAGKTTTLRVLTGFMPASSGTATVVGHDVFSQSMKIREQIGYLPESTPLYPEMRVNEYLKFRSKLKQVPQSEIAERIADVVDKCWLGDFITRPIGQLSKGMRQRVGLADALINDPQVMFLDEPTIGLDPTQIRETRNLISELGKKHTIMLSSHILSEVEAICNRVIIIARGKIVAQGSPQELSTRVSEGSCLIAEIKGPEGEVKSALERLDGFQAVGAQTTNGWQHLRIEPKDGQDVREQIVQLAVQSGWPMREIRREVASLEDYFVKIVAEQKQ